MNPISPSPAARAAGFLLLGIACVGADWPHYRGPRGDGVYPGTVRTNWTAQTPRVLWRKPIEPALSSIAVADGRAFTQARRRVGSQDREHVVALEAATGKELWAVDVDLADYPDGGVGGDDGPRSTPAVENGRVYVFTTYLRLYCFDAATGREIWKRDFPSELGSSVVSWQNAASPVLVGDLILVNGNGSPNRLMGIRKSDGSTAWRKHDARMTQATPVAATVAGVSQVIFFAQPGLFSVRPETGDLLWQFAFPFSTSTAASPVVADDVVFCSAAYSSGSGAVRLTASGTSLSSRELYKRRSANMAHWATPVAKDGHLYGVFGQSSLSVRCVQAASGTETWRTVGVGTGEIGYGSILLVDGRLFLCSESGEIVLAEADPQAYREIDRFQAVSGKCWNSPAIADGILYARSTSQIAAIDLRPPAPPSPVAFAPRIVFADGRARLEVRSSDGTPLTAQRAQGIGLLRADDPSTPREGWAPVDATRSFSDGALILEDPGSGGVPRRFYRARE